MKHNFYICQYLVLHHELKDLIDYGLRTLMCELMHDNTYMFIVKMMIYMSKLEEEGIPCLTKKKNN